ncbi:unnamed protein product [Pylaiella littoralis]
MAGEGGFVYFWLYFFGGGFRNDHHAHSSNTQQRVRSRSSAYFQAQHVTLLLDDGRRTFQRITSYAEQQWFVENGEHESTERRDLFSLLPRNLHLLAGMALVSC